MKYINFRVLKFGPFDLREEGILETINASVPGLNHSLEPNYQVATLTDCLNHFHPSSLRIELNNNDFDSQLTFESVSLDLFSGGFGILKSIAQLKDETSLEQVIEVQDYLSEVIDQWTESSPLTKTISRTFGNWWTLNESDYLEPKLMWAFSQICVFDSEAGLSSFAEKMSMATGKKFSGGHAFFNSELGAVWFYDHDRYERALQLWGSVTLSTAISYDIQSTAISLSRSILKDKDLGSRISAVDLYIRSVNIMDQLLTEINQDDFTADIDETDFAKPIAEEFQLTELSEKVLRANGRLKDHVQLLESALARHQQKRMANILFVFTMLSIASVSGGLVALYDIPNAIPPDTRLVLVGLSLFSAVALTWLWLTNRKLPQVERLFRRKR